MRFTLPLKHTWQICFVSDDLFVRLEWKMWAYTWRMSERVGRWGWLFETWPGGQLDSWRASFVSPSHAVSDLNCPAWIKWFLMLKRFSPLLRNIKQLSVSRQNDVYVLACQSNVCGFQLKIHSAMMFLFSSPNRLRLTVNKEMTLWGKWAAKGITLIYFLLFEHNSDSRFRTRVPGGGVIIWHEEQEANRRRGPALRAS